MKVGGLKGKGKVVGRVSSQKRRDFQCPVGESRDIVDGGYAGDTAGKPEKQERLLLKLHQ